MRTFSVVVHDVHPGAERPLDAVLRSLARRLGRRFTLAVVPRWGDRDADGAWARLWERWSARGPDLALHGLTHRARQPGIVSLLTRRADEFARAPLDDARRSLALAQGFAERTFGRRLAGLVPPAWLFPFRARDVEDLGVEFIARFMRLEGRARSRPLRTLSWDWGVLPGIERAGAFAGSALGRALARDAHVVVAVHPEDVRRGVFPVIEAQLDRLLAGRSTPLTLTEVATELR